LLTPRTKAILQNVAAYAIAAAIISYASRGVSWSQVAAACHHSSLLLFLLASTAGFLIWFIGETFLYSRLFSYFHAPTTPRELIPTMAAVYFLQIVNSWVAGGAFVLFLHVRKHVPWLMSGCTLLFQGYLDAILFTALTLLAIAVVPSSPIRLGLIYAAAALAACSLVASFFLSWGSRLRTTNWLRWMFYDRPSMSTFRIAQPWQYARLFGIRLLIVIGAGLALYGQFVSFHIKVPLLQTLALTPFIVAIGNSPFSPGGIGTTQLVFTLAFARFAAKDDLFALSLAVTVFNLVVRMPMGLAMGAPLAAEAVEVETEFVPVRKVAQL
jgi:uncharacterized membrane protein YbhN (UPF0104 family)